ncbi:ELM1/GtrOC1 family putative glycosyltransferase [Lacibacterium aquatile]|uniref:ELM1/GtrOC1 family putative glycosyltransferase n=1 Tax=Lacibacterium aquatile TaxID=1168082 RepID=A0ABW5DYT5_9PROT
MIWVLLGRRAGDNKQMLALARATGLPFTALQMGFNGASALPNILLGSRRISLDPASKAKLIAPWPLAVITSGRRAVPAARWIKAMSGGTTRLIHIGRPWGPPEWFDLVVTTPQYGLPDLPNIQANLMPLTQEIGKEGGTARPAWLEALPRPLLGVLVGGNSRPLVLDAAAAERLADTALDMARNMGGGLVLSTSPRTSGEVAEILQRRLKVSEVPHVVALWRAGVANDYEGILRQSDRLLVTGDSAAMMADAVLSGRPTEIFPLPEKPDFRWRSAHYVSSLLSGFPLGLRVLERLMGWGMLSSVRDIGAYERGLRAADLLRGGDAARMQGRAELAASALRVRQLLS